ncbi:MAG: hypothetical protein Q7R87_03650 [Nanoarchaeota archaeon]|nr:hypothetical protein [Nanoarchaeota archaeon]
MGVFDNGDYVDYTLLKKRGLLKESDQEVKKDNSNSGFVDFTSSATNSSSSNIPSSSSTNPFDLLSSLTSSNSSSNPGVESSNSLSSVYPNNISSSDEVNALKLKVEDLEYKIQRLIEKIDSMNIGK